MFEGFSFLVKTFLSLMSSTKVSITMSLKLLVSWHWGTHISTNIAHQKIHHPQQDHIEMLVYGPVVPFLINVGLGSFVIM